MECFLLRIQGKAVDVDGEDMVFWVETKSVSFFVKSLYSILEGGRVEPFPTSVVWNAWIPPKVSFFAWEATWGKVLTLDQLQRRGWSLVNGCSLCFAQEESIDRILLHWGKARVLWELLLSLFEMCWVIHSIVRETLLGWHDSFVRRKRKKVWRATPLSFFGQYEKREIENLSTM